MDNKGYKCRVCYSTEKGVEFLYPDSLGNDRLIRICGQCDAALPNLINEHNSASEETSAQALSHAHRWAYAPSESIYDVVRDLTLMVDAFASVIGHPTPNRIIAEIGAGRGALIRALLDRGYAAIGCEPSGQLAEQAYAMLNLSKAQILNCGWQEFLLTLESNNCKPSTIILWHVLEHIWDPLSLLQIAYKQLQPDGLLLMQVPMLASKYIFDEHLFFPSTRTISYLASHLHGAQLKTSFDDSNLYMTIEILKTSNANANLEGRSGNFMTEAIEARDRNIESLRQDLESAKKEIAALEIQLTSDATRKKDTTITPFQEVEIRMNEKLNESREATDLLEQRVRTLHRALSETESIRIVQAEQLKHLEQALISSKESLLTTQDRVQKIELINSELTAQTLALGEQAEHLKNILDTNREQSRQVLLDLGRQNSTLDSTLTAFTELHQQHTGLIASLAQEERRNEFLTEEANQLREMLSLNIAEKQQLARDLGHIASNIEQHENSFPVRMAKKLGILNSISLRATPTDNHSYEENAHPLSRSRDFRERSHNRYWWHKLERTKYTPLIYSSMTNKEWALMEEWFNDTELKYESTGEANIPPLSLLAGLISGNGISRIVQCGHYVGYSTLVLGFLLKKQGVDKGLFSIDIDAEVTAYTQQWLDQGELNNVVRLHIGDSASDEAAAGAEAYLGDLPQLVFIDSSHQYSHTLKELDLWFDKLAPGGLLVLHDTSAFAAGFDSTEGGGVLKAVIEWCESRAIHPLSINAFVRGGTPGDVPYLDGCGITIIQKPTA